MYMLQQQKQRMYKEVSVFCMALWGVCLFWWRSAYLCPCQCSIWLDVEDSEMFKIANVQHVFLFKEKSFPWNPSRPLVPTCCKTQAKARFKERIRRGIFFLFVIAFLCPCRLSRWFCFENSTMIKFVNVQKSFSLREKSLSIKSLATSCPHMLDNSSNPSKV